MGFVIGQKGVKMGRLIYEEDAIKKIEKTMCEDGFRSSTGLIHKETAYEAIKSVPSAQPERKTGKWIECDHEKWSGDTFAYRCLSALEHTI